MSLWSCLLILCWLPLSDAGTNAEGRKFLKENKKREEVITTASGLQYEVLGSGPVFGTEPKPHSKCVCHYKGTLLTGEEFDSSYSRGAPTTFQPNQVVAGWSEALQLMKPGDKWRLWLPSELAYGDKGAGKQIPGGAVLVFDLELLEVKEGGEDLFTSIMDLIKRQPLLLLCAGYTCFWIFCQLVSSGASIKELNIGDALMDDENQKVFLCIQIGQDPPERVEIELFSHHYPKTCKNFHALCTGEKGVGKSGKKLTYKGSIFHRVIPDFMCQGGDFTRANGTGGESIYGPRFEDEWVAGYISHSRAGLLSMANAGKDTNGSQFFITLSACKHLDMKHVVFGHVVSGMDVVRKIEKCGTSGGSPKDKILISDCGEMKSKST